LLLWFLGSKASLRQSLPFWASSATWWQASFFLEEKWEMPSTWWDILFYYNFYFRKKYHCQLFFIYKTYSHTWANDHLRIATRVQLHQQFMSSFFKRKCFFCRFSLITVWLWYYLCEGILEQKLLVKCWWNWLLLSTTTTILWSYIRWPLNNDHLSTTATILGSQFWIFGYLVFSEDIKFFLLSTLLRINPWTKRSIFLI